MKLRNKHTDMLMAEQTLVDIYTDNYNETHYGFIVDYNDTFLLLETYDSQCVYNGFVVFQSENITRIRWGGNEIMSVLALIDTSKRLNVKGSIELTSMESVIRSAHALFTHVSVYFQDIDKGACVIGEVVDLDNETLIIHEYGTMSTLDRRHIMLDVDDVTQVDMGGHYEKRLEKLFKGQSFS